MPPLLCAAGLGYTASALAAQLCEEKWSILGTSRNPSHHPLSGLKGCEIMIPQDFPAALEKSPPAPLHLLISAPPQEQETGVDPFLPLIGAWLATHKETVRWIGYLSTTGVYGDHAGGWVDETTPPTPSNDRLRRRVQAESDWLALYEQYGLPVHIFRLAGIYGSGRNALIQLRQGSAKRIFKPGQFFSRIHREDILQLLRASMAQPAPGRIYNVCDNEPAPASEVMAYAAALLGVRPPPLMSFKTAHLSPMARSFYGASRRVKNNRIRQELGVTLLYPDYRAGLHALAREENI